MTRDRAEMIHFAGRHRLSPALRDGEPALVAQGDPGGRCGWEPFFRAMGARRLALEDGGEGGTFRLVPAVSRARRRSGPGAIAEARRFLAALLGRPPKRGPRE